MIFHIWFRSLLLRDHDMITDVYMLDLFWCVVN